MDSYTKLYSLIQDCDINDDYDQRTEMIDTLKQVRDDHKHSYAKLQLLYDDIKHEFDSQKQKFDEQDKQIALLNNILSDISIIREYINKLFGKLWNIYQKDIESANPNFKDLSDKTPLINKYKKLEYEKNNGIKFALYTLDNNPCPVASPELCNFYLALNAKYHPEIKPTSVILNSLKSIEQIMQADQLPNHYKSSGLNIKVLDELKRDIKIYDPTMK